jgi:hypothetical protein
MNDIYNIQNNFRLQNLAGKTPMEALINILKTSNYIFNYRTSNIDRVTHLFFAHPMSVEMLVQYPEVLLLDCTYQTNRFKMPLLNIIGISSVNLPFFVAFCFLAKEEEDDYTWAMKQLRLLLLNNIQPQVMMTDRDLALINAIHMIFSCTKNVICIWYVEKNVLIHASAAFKKEEDIKTFMKD